MPRHSELDWQVAAVADTQDGLITSAQLASLGVARSTIHYRTHLGGMWNRVLPGVHSIAGPTLDDRQRARAALLYGGPRSMLTGFSALRLFGVMAGQSPVGDAPPVHILIGDGRRRVANGFILVERTVRLPDAVVIAGLPVAPAPRAVVDACHRCRRRSDVFAVVTEAASKGMATTEELRRELALGSRRGTSFLREALDHAAHGSWSGPEAELRAGVLRSSLPEPHWNVALMAPDGTVIAVADGYYEDVGLALEVDSRRFHSGIEEWERTLRRASALTSHGVVILHFTPNRIRRELAEVIGEIAAARRLLIGRPLPELRVTAATSPGTWSSHADSRPGADRVP